MSPTARAAVALSVTSTSSIDGVTASPGSPPFDIFPFADDGAGNSTFGHTYSYGDGVIGSRSSGQNTYSINGTARYTNTFTASQTGSYTFTYVLSQGELNASALPGAAGGGQQSAVSALITEAIDSAGPTTLLNYQASMTLGTLGTTPVFAESGLVLNPGGPSLATDSGSYFWDQYIGTVSLGTLLAGQTVVINYTIQSSAEGSTTPGIASGGCGYGYGFGCYGEPSMIAVSNICAFAIFDGGGCGDSFYTMGSAIGRIGDPLDIASSAFGIAVVPVAAPEPASMGVLGAGLAGLAFMRRRRSKI